MAAIIVTCSIIPVASAAALESPLKNREAQNLADHLTDAYFYRSRCKIVEVDERNAEAAVKLIGVANRLYGQEINSKELSNYLADRLELELRTRVDPPAGGWCVRALDEYGENGYKDKQLLRLQR